MTLLYLDDFFQQHHTRTHPENARRLMAVHAELTRQGLVDQCQLPSWAPATLEQQLSVHTSEHLQHLQHVADQGGGWIEQDTILSAASYRVAAHASGAVLDAVSRVIKGEDQTAFCAIRPPGHHALSNHAMGFCLLNHVAIAARSACNDHGLERVLIVDWDVHHGNGTQAIFWEAPHVGFLSAHRWPFYPGTGSETETGSGPGLGSTLNVPIEFGTPVDQFHDRFSRSLEWLAEKMKPQLILLSAGFDAHRDDPVGSLGLDDHDFAILTQRVREIANHYANGRIVSLLEGGYHPLALARSVAVHLQGLLTQDNQPH